MSETTTNQQKPTAVQTTGHAWDGDLQEFNNPLPRWWLWSFYATVVFAVIYWFLYPTWPVGSSWTKGVLSATFTEGGKQETMRWNTRSALLEDLQTGADATRQREYFEKIAAADFATIQKDPQMLAFVNQAGKRIFETNCSACHGRGGQGVVGLFPNLVDDDWLWGGTFKDIQYTITHGRNGYMPSFKGTLNTAQLDDVASYVLSLSGEVQADEASARGKQIFEGPVGGCYMCHGDAAKGIKSMGSANLTDKIWTLANVPAATTPEAKIEAVKAVVSNGVINVRTMPAWDGRMSADEIKLMAVYIHQLGGGQ
ncbi:cytochrome-c oxidase, cbb3-type subunit III [Plasticicumulans acidivorans]|uniref:Cbb3-type cytochrome c oxidase subunit n=1 Tax=Plasticicumulans acidivorans TaxID=886464 RepID=A0A317MUV8_9GAMM|nr:cytochrome-c oxidase, cbb3-type subunit III [Plasticicumulans acidivorans]PWV61707.1 cytochrome c oxidase cbb3-type subunit 3 [Plasticicumulans acidivorans]